MHDLALKIQLIDLIQKNSSVQLYLVPRAYLMLQFEIWSMELTVERCAMIRKIDTIICHGKWDFEFLGFIREAKRNKEDRVNLKVVNNSISTNIKRADWICFSPSFCFIVSAFRLAYLLKWNVSDEVRLILTRWLVVDELYEHTSLLVLLCSKIDTFVRIKQP